MVHLASQRHDGIAEVCLRSTYFQVGDKFFQQNNDMAMGSSLSLVISNIFMQHYEEVVFDTAHHKSHYGSSM
jgi:hypothetical protein